MTPSFLLRGSGGQGAHCAVQDKVPQPIAMSDDHANQRDFMSPNVTLFVFIVNLQTSLPGADNNPKTKVHDHQWPDPKPTCRSPNQMMHPAAGICCITVQDRAHTLELHMSEDTLKAQQAFMTTRKSSSASYARHT